MPRFRLDPLAPNGLSVAPEPVQVQRQNNGYVVKDITGMITAGTNVALTGNGTSGNPYQISSTGGVSAWGDLTGTLSNQTDLQAALDAKLGDTTDTLIGNFTVADALTALKAYRYRTSGSSLDFDAGGESMYFSVYDNADFTGTQYNKIRLGKGDYSSFAQLWEWKKGNNLSGTTSHVINADGGVIFNEQGDDYDFRVESDTDTHNIFSDASTDRVGIGTDTPTAKLDVNGDTLRLRTAKTPASATTAGNAGDIAWDANYIYICVATNTWRRTAHATW